MITRRLCLFPSSSDQRRYQKLLQQNSVITHIIPNIPYFNCIIVSAEIKIATTIYILYVFQQFLILHLINIQYTRIWKLASADEKKNLKLKVDVTYQKLQGQPLTSEGKEDVRSRLSRETERVKEVEHRSKEGTEDDSREEGTSESIFADLLNLRDKYDALIEYTVLLTAERDTIVQRLDETEKQLAREASRSNVSRAESPKSKKLDKLGGMKVLSASLYPLSFSICLSVYYNYTFYLSLTHTLSFFRAHTLSLSDTHILSSTIDLLSAFSYLLLSVTFSIFSNLFHCLSLILSLPLFLSLPQSISLSLYLSLYFSLSLRFASLLSSPLSFFSLSLSLSPSPSLSIPHFFMSTSH